MILNVSIHDAFEFMEETEPGALEFMVECVWYIEVSRGSVTRRLAVRKRV